ncbi:hypothetical protein [Stenotrophomonas rhizophila]|uniref:hypothetical protein n=1 Tax=Stenotrophomonas rhizophila TaxID=216778 RepID=UPI000456E3BF|nr:hypothetical protein [Stenotrophomonas rhizophila]AHY58583.1 hypothetical protein DX03_07785 [Stenotrophomonas rhizophila]
MTLFRSVVPFVFLSAGGVLLWRGMQAVLTTAQSLGTDGGGSAFQYGYAAGHSAAAALMLAAAAACALLGGRGRVQRGQARCVGPGYDDA